ncbi:hypothetical protein G6011_01265 [Alternaria panax]|uniref:Uncharacterized protein n=1 Tax=Alternaria panax TaxID=48097 RepID=A0AAD4IKS5_9PLEO|nr:hypothetical protein G6011_01265 [Alternaria panax]
MELEENPLGTLSTLAKELRETIWSYALTDTTIVYHAITKTVPIPLLGCSRVIREEVLSTILRERSVTFQTHAALSALLENCKSEKTTDATTHETSAAPGQVRLPKKIRLSLFCGDYQAYKTAKASVGPIQEDLGRVNEDDYESELDGWRDALQRFPITHLTTVTLDCTLSPRYYGGPGDAPPGMTRFTKRVARIRMGSEGKCQCLLVAPSTTLRQLMWHAGTGSLLREWTPADDGWSTKKIQAFDFSLSAEPMDFRLHQASDGFHSFSNTRQLADTPSSSTHLTTYHYGQGQPRMRKRRRTDRD